MGMATNTTSNAKIQVDRLAEMVRAHGHKAIKTADGLLVGIMWTNPFGDPRWGRRGYEWTYCTGLVSVRNVLGY